MFKLVIFDLDGTLAESKQPISSEMAAMLRELLNRTRVAIISGGTMSQFLRQVVARLTNRPNLAHLYLLPTSGAMLYEFQHDGWNKIYEERLSEKEAHTIETAMREAARETGIINFSEPAWGERIEYRGGQVTMSALGQDAPLAEKKAWDPDHAKRRKLQKAIAEKLPEFSVGMGGATTIDVTKREIDKAYGIHQLCKRIGVNESDALYIGDELMAGGNDETVYKTAVATCVVDNPSDTIRTIKTLLTSA